MELSINSPFYRSSYEALLAFCEISNAAAALQIAGQALIASAKSAPIFLNVLISDEACFSASAMGCGSDD